MVERVPVPTARRVLGMGGLALRDRTRRSGTGPSRRRRHERRQQAQGDQLQPFRDPAGNVTGVVGMAVDITDRVRREAEVRAGQRLLRQVLETLPVGVMVLDRAGDIMLVNPAAGHIWGGTIVSGRERWVK